MSGTTLLCGHCGRPIVDANFTWGGSTPYHSDCTRSPYYHQTTLQAEVDQLRAELAEAALNAQLAKAEADAQIYVPGSWECPKCNFQLTKSYLHPNGISPNLKSVELCPNDGESMRRCTWKKDAIALSDRLATEIPKLRVAEEALAEARKDSERDTQSLAAKIARWAYGYYKGYSAGSSPALAYWDLVGHRLPGPVFTVEIIKEMLDAARAQSGAPERKEGK